RANDRQAGGGRVQHLDWNAGTEPSRRNKNPVTIVVRPKVVYDAERDDGWSDKGGKPRRLVPACHGQSNIRAELQTQKREHMSCEPHDRIAVRSGVIDHRASKEEPRALDERTRGRVRNHAVSENLDVRESSLRKSRGLGKRNGQDQITVAGEPGLFTYYPAH